MDRLTEIIQHLMNDHPQPNSPKPSLTPTKIAAEKNPPSDHACDTCGGLGWLALDAPTAHPDFGRLTRCPQCTNWLLHSRLTKEEQQHTLADLKNRPDDPRREMVVLRFLAKRMLEDPFGFLTLYGHKGGGKSLLLTALIADFCRQGTRAVYFNIGDLVTMLSPGEENEIDNFRRAGNYEAAKGQLKKIPVIAVDEMDKIKWTPWQVQQIGEIIEERHRHAARLVTLFAMNHPPHHWLNPLGVEHIASRFADGRFNRPWPDEIKTLPASLNSRREAPALFEVTLPDMRPALRRPRQPPE